MDTEKQSRDEEMRDERRGGRTGMWRVLFLLVVIALIVSFSFPGGVYGDRLPRVAKDKWQAVFLSNNQVYFGRLREVNRSYVSLSQVFYLRAVQPLQQGAEAPPPQFNLAKLGGELHGPEDIMYIPKNVILFWENMRDDSQVAQAIINFLNPQSQ